MTSLHCGGPSLPNCLENEVVPAAWIWDRARLDQARAVLRAALAAHADPGDGALAARSAALLGGRGAGVAADREHQDLFLVALELAGRLDAAQPVGGCRLAGRPAFALRPALAL